MRQGFDFDLIRSKINDVAKREDLEDTDGF